MVLHFSNSLSSSRRKDLNASFLLLSLSLPLNVLKSPLILGNNKTNGLINSSKYPIKYLELYFISTNFEMTKLLTSTSQIFIGFCEPQKYSIATFILSNHNIIIL